MTKIINNISSWLSQREQVRRTRRELAALTDKDLADIGVSRCDIDRIANDYLNKKAA